ncbi:MAG: hypothetical protein PHN26_08590 [Eubacteriaceae bacterium]|nr:hypothetical protein [Eubacteriaceae bacterium]
MSVSEQSPRLMVRNIQLFLPFLFQWKKFEIVILIFTADDERAAGEFHRHRRLVCER